jgi:hypothetical protein
MLTDRWHKSSHSGDASNCVCIKFTSEGKIYIRDSKSPDIAITTTPLSLNSFIAAVRQQTSLLLPLRHPTAALGVSVDQNP